MTWDLDGLDNHEMKGKGEHMTWDWGGLGTCGAWPVAIFGPCTWQNEEVSCQNASQQCKVQILSGVGLRHDTPVLYMFVREKDRHVISLEGFCRV